MPARVRIAAAAVVALVALAGMILVVVRIRSDQSGIGRLSFASTRPAAAPFDAFTETRLAVGSRCLRVLVASTPSQREQGLRRVRSLRPYDGMVFVEQHDSTGLYTMAHAFVPLVITFFTAKGAPVDEVRMVPCPNGTDATCPVYGAKKPYRYALERPVGSASASGALGACSA
ncbi:MAG TPA: DUF192 domain-containing protein [Acidimicrobiia bacterium]|nr:DUF192 domain-containing protein [Acidimicrobiia bacterium]